MFEEATSLPPPESPRQRVIDRKCKLLHPQGSECGVCPCRSPEQCNSEAGRRVWLERTKTNKGT